MHDVYRLAIFSLLITLFASHGYTHVVLVSAIRLLDSHSLLSVLSPDLSITVALDCFISVVELGLVGLGVARVRAYILGVVVGCAAIMVGRLILTMLVRGVSVTVVLLSDVVVTGWNVRGVTSMADVLTVSVAWVNMLTVHAMAYIAMLIMLIIVIRGSMSISGLNISVLAVAVAALAMSSVCVLAVAVALVTMGSISMLAVAAVRGWDMLNVEARVSMVYTMTEAVTNIGIAMTLASISVLSVVTGSVDVMRRGNVGV